MATIRKVVDKFAEWFCIFLLAAMTCLVTYQVVVRYFFDAPCTFSEALSKYLFIWLVMICGAYVFGLREHMDIGYLRDKLSHKPRILLNMINEFIIAVFAIGVMIIGGYSGATRQMIQLDAALEIPIGLIYMAIPIGGVMILFYFICNEIRLFSQLNVSEKDNNKGGV